VFLGHYIVLIILLKSSGFKWIKKELPAIKLRQLNHFNMKAVQSFMK